MTKNNKSLLILILACVSILMLTLLCACNTNVESKLSVKYDYSHEVYEGESLESLRPYLTVTYTDDKGNEREVSNYSLYGSLEKGYNELEIKYLDITESFNVFAQTLKHIAKFSVDGVIIDAQIFGDTKDIVPPSIPEKVGYDGVWENYSSVTGDVTVNAVYTPKEYTITFEYDGATGGNEELTRTVVYKQAIGDLPVPTKEGSLFVGWFNRLYSKDKWVEEEYTLTQDITLYADWYNTSVPSEGLQFELNEDGQSYSVAKFYENYLSREIVIPSTYNGKPVTSITAFSYLLNVLECITIPSSIKTMSGGFWGEEFSNLKTVNYLGSLEDWYNIEFQSEGSNPLYYNASLLIDGKSVTHIEIPNTVNRINDYAFYGCGSITGITIPSSVTSIGRNAFGKCINVDKITVSADNTVYYVEDNCLIETATKTLLQGFNNSSIPSDIITIGDYAFSYCNQLTQVIIPDSVTTICQGAFSHSGITSVTMPDSVVTIGKSAFASCEDLSGLTIGNGVTVICDYAFYNCEKLTDISIPASVINLGENVFMFCTEIESITVDKNNAKYYSESNCLIETATQVLILGCKNSIIPTGVKEIKAYAFFNQNGLESILIPDSVTIIGEGAFHQCYNLEILIMSQNVVTIESYAFQHCRMLKSIILPSTLTNIEGPVFSGCKELEIIVFKGTVDEWNSLIHYDFWYDYTSVNKVICIDGEAEITRHFDSPIY